MEEFGDASLGYYESFPINIANTFRVRVNVEADQEGVGNRLRSITKCIQGISHVLGWPEMSIGFFLLLLFFNSLQKTQTNFLAKPILDLRKEALPPKSPVMCGLHKIPCTSKNLWLERQPLLHGIYIKQQFSSS